MKLNDKKEEKLIDLLYEARDNGDYKAAEKLIKKLKKGESEELQEILDRFLDDAIVYQTPKWIEIFLKNGANPNISNGLPELALAMKVDFQMGQKFIEYGADVNFSDKSDGYTTLMVLAQETYFYDDQLLYLIEHGADVNLADTNGKTAIMYSLDEGNLSGFNILAEHGANLLSIDKDGKSVLDYAHEAAEAGILKPKELKKIEQKIAEAELKKVDEKLAAMGSSQKPKIAPKVADGLER